MPPDSANVALGRETLKGSVWMSLNTVVGKVASLGAQVILARLLAKDDFGIYAIAISISVFASAFKDGGVRQLLVQRQNEYEQLLGPVFWLATVCNVLTAAVIALAAPVASWAYHAPVLVPMLLVIALSVVMGTPGAVLSARLNIDFRFRELAVVQVWSAVLRYGGSVALALAGMGPMSFVLPLPVVALAEWAITRYYNRDRLWSRPFGRERWGELFAQTRWILLGAFAIAAFNMGNFFLVGLVVDKAVVGVYFFAYSIVLQVGTLLAANSVQVLFPVFSRVADDPERQRRGIIKCMRQLAIIAAPFAVGLVPTFGPLESFVWAGRWDEAVRPVQMLAALYPMHVVMAVGLAAIQAAGLFRRWAVSYILLMLGMMACGVLAAKFRATPDAIAGTLAVYMFVGSLIYLVQAVRPAGVRAGEVLTATLPSWLIALAAAGAGLAAVRSLPPTQGPIPQFLAGGAVFTVLYALGVRALLAPHLDEAIQASPVRIRAVLARVLLRPIPGADS